MIEEKYKRKLTAILSADVEGYSRLMGEDEDMTVHTIKAYRELVADLIKKHNGRVIDSPGDNILAEFVSVVDAVRCAVEIQEETKERNADLPENRRMAFRIGVNLGDVIEDENRIYGDGVNIAARVESLADGGGICISGSVYKQVKNKLAFGYEYLGERTVKNISEPVNIYRILIEPEAVGKVIGEKKARLKGRQRAFVAIIAMFVVVAVVAVWSFKLHFTLSKEKTAAISQSATPLAEKASIAVLPFKNLSGDPEQEYFSDGITNDIITDLSKFREMLVIASNTVFIYKGKPIKVNEISRELGVQYVLEGTVQKLSKKVRINAQLIDAAKGHHLWAERYDKDINDLFAVQDEIVHTIVTTLAIKVGKAERTRAMRKNTGNLAAYDYYLRGWEHRNRRTRAENIESKEMFKKAIELDPGYANAHIGLGRAYLNEVTYGWTEFPAEALQHALDLVRKALTLDESDAGAHALLGTLYVYKGEYNLALSELKRAIDLNPNDASSYRNLGLVMLYSGHTDEAIDAVKTTLRFDPNTSFSAYFFLGMGYYLKGQYDRAIPPLKKGVGRKADFMDFHVALAATYARSGRQEEALKEAERVLELNPFFEADAYGTVFRNPKDRAKIIEGLRMAGLK